MILAAIDIGSNAVRLQINRPITYNGVTIFKKLQYIRFPLRLGSDVFENNQIGDQKFREFITLMRAFKAMIDLYKVDEYYACATSAMREAENGNALIQAVKAACDLDINIISGDLEAELINRVIAFNLVEDQQYLHIDVGGGSTELTLYRGEVKNVSKSFPIGTVRLLKHSERVGTWDEMLQWIIDHKGKVGHLIAIGTGGNIRKLYELTNKEKGKYIGIQKLEEELEILKNMPYEERVVNLQLNEDRADVIIPASEIYISIMKKAGARKIMVPDVGLKDGIISYLYDKNQVSS
ncbi:phosphatase [Reichenbachiella carrageenanivorans]|uniref:Phosphatase n=1 Tax=Reichenbachiella carrageenanivorans TaxID=2979869 RepID=A0ABY6D1P5_9BACT|nr:phosphatase [Reichenbachiella carrageenanivorans]UXX77780.1 phosphatase [Reichenbachiella carrageenanivorans]